MSAKQNVPRWCTIAVHIAACALVPVNNFAGSLLLMMHAVWVNHSTRRCAAHPPAPAL
jgi:hypothetical protein